MIDDMKGLDLNEKCLQILEKWSATSSMAEQVRPGEQEQE